MHSINSRLTHESVTLILGNSIPFTDASRMAEKYASSIVLIGAITPTHIYVHCVVMKVVPGRRKEIIIILDVGPSPQRSFSLHVSSSDEFEQAHRGLCPGKR